MNLVQTVLYTSTSKYR